MPIPALNIIAIQDTVRNSGSSPSRPSVMLPNRLRASHSTNTTNALDVSTNSQPVFVITQVSDLPETSARLLVLAKPQTRKAMAIAAVTPKTTLSSPPPFSGAVWSTGTSRAGCGTTSLTGEARASRTRWR